MFQTERDALKVDVPVGFLLPEAREILVSVDRPADTPLSIRLRLIPAEGARFVDGRESPRPASNETPPPARRLTRQRQNDDYGEHEYGGGD